MTPLVPSKQNKIKKSNQNEELIKSYLIPTSTTKSTTKKEINKSNQIINKSQNQIQLNLITSNFYCLPIYNLKDFKKIINLYISTKVSFSNQENNEDERKRTILMMNLDQNFKLEEIKILLSYNLNIEIDQIEVFIQDYDDQKKENFRIGFIERELEIEELIKGFNQTVELTKSKSKKKKESSKPIKLPSLFIENHNLKFQLNRSLLPNALIRFKSSNQLLQLLSIDHSKLPLQWPSSFSTSENHQSNWLSKYRTQRKLLRPSFESVKAHTDAWMLASESGIIKPLSLIVKGKSVQKGSEEEENEMKENEDDGEGEWITVTRGGQHGRSSTIPTQPQSIKGSDPYAQSSMAGRDSFAPVKVMKRGFLDAFDKDEIDCQLNSKRKGGELNTGFYRTNVNENKKTKMFEIRKKFDEDKARVERMRNTRKFKPY